MWGNDNSFSGGGGGGGFVPSDGRFNSPATGDKAQSRVKRTQNIFPVTIKQLADCTDETLRIQDTEVSVVSILGVVKTVEESSTKISYVLDDQTGSIEALSYMGTEENSSRPVLLEEGTYGRIIGSLRTTKGASTGSNKYILIFKAYPILDMNELTSHMLEVIQVPIKMKKLKEQQAAKIDSGAVGNPALSNSMLGTPAVGATGVGDTSYGSSSLGALNGLTANQNMVFRCIQSVKSENGVHVDQVIANLRNKMNPKDIKAAMEFLSGEGHIYTTSDDDHYMCTEW